MFAKLKSSKLALVVAAIVAVTIIVVYCVLSGNSTDNTVYYIDLATYTLVGVLVLLGIWLAGKGRKAIAIAVVCVSLLLPVFLNPVLTSGSSGVPYTLQAALYAKMTMTMLCPFLALALLKWLCRVTKERRYGVAIMSLGYFAIAFLVTALIHDLTKWQYYYCYGYDTTWNAVESFYWLVTINVVYIWHMLGDTVDDSKKSRRYCCIFTLIADVIAALTLVLTSEHLRSILSGGITTWLSYRLEIFKGIFKGELTVGTSTFLANFPDEFPVSVSWSSEPLVSIGLTYGILASIAMLVLLAILIAMLYTIKTNRNSSDEIGSSIRYSFTAMLCMSTAGQLFVPAYELMTPLIGNGTCMIALLIVYLALPYVIPEGTD